MSASEIKQRLNRYIAGQGYANQRTAELLQIYFDTRNEFKQHAPVDIEYLLAENERLTEELNRVVDKKENDDGDQKNS